MERLEMKFSTKNVDYLFNAGFQSVLEGLNQKCIIITDENVFSLWENSLTKYAVIKIPAGESVKRQHTVDNIIDQLLEMQADKDAVIVGLGGGVVTDIAGYVASIFKRGIGLLQIPTSILAMVDAAVGGKNGVNTASYKNMVGTIYQPETVVFDYAFLQTLPREEWVNGFAEVIKHACIKDAELFNELMQHNIDYYYNDPANAAALIKRNVLIKTNVVLGDELETGDRMLLNFGHTLGHAIEKEYDMPHGHAISIGMMAACTISEEINNFYSEDKEKVKNLLEKYGLPVRKNFDKEKIWKLLESDKKRKSDAMNFVLLNKIGDAKVQKISLLQLHDLIEQVL